MTFCSYLLQTQASLKLHVFQEIFLLKATRILWTPGTALIYAEQLPTCFMRSSAGIRLELIRFDTCYTSSINNPQRNMQKKDCRNNSISDKNLNNLFHMFSSFIYSIIHDSANCFYIKQFEYVTIYLSFTFSSDIKNKDDKITT